MLACKHPGERRADCAARHVDSIRFKTRRDAAVAEDHLLNGTIVGEHRDRSFRVPACGCRRIRYMGAFFRQSFGFLPCAVVHRNLMARAQQIARHAGPHSAEPNESDLHNCQLTAAIFRAVSFSIYTDVLAMATSVATALSLPYPRIGTPVSQEQSRRRRHGAATVLYVSESRRPQPGERAHHVPESLPTPPPTARMHLDADRVPLHQLRFQAAEAPRSMRDNERLRSLECRAGERCPPRCQPGESSR